MYEEPARVVSLDCTDKDEPSDENHGVGSNIPAIGVNYWASTVSSWRYPHSGNITYFTIGNTVSTSLISLVKVVKPKSVSGAYNTGTHGSMMIFSIFSR